MTIRQLIEEGEFDDKDELLSGRSDWATDWLNTAAPALGFEQASGIWYKDTGRRMVKLWLNYQKDNQISVMRFNRVHGRGGDVHWKFDWAGQMNPNEVADFLREWEMI